MNNKEEEFVYSDAVASLEKIASEVEDPSTGLEDIEKRIAEADKLVAQCRSYLRTARKKADSFENS